MSLWFWWGWTCFIGWAITLLYVRRRPRIKINNILLNGKDQLQKPIVLGADDVLVLEGQDNSDKVELRLGRSAIRQPKPDEKPWWERM